MMMRDEGKLVIWPACIDRNRTRSEGRIISRKSSVQHPGLDEINKAAESLGLNPRSEPEKAYPRFWWEKSGRVLVDKTASKTTVARNIAKTIKKERGN